MTVELTNTLRWFITKKYTQDICVCRASTVRRLSVLRCLLSSGRDRLEYWHRAIIGTAPSMARQRVRIVVFIRMHVIAFAMVLSGYIMTGQAREGASDSGWQVVFDDEVTEHHFCHSANSGASVFCACSKMHAGITRACSVAQVGLRSANWDAINAKYCGKLR